MRHYAHLFLVLTLLCMLLLSCTQPVAPAASPSMGETSAVEAATGEPQRGGTLTAAIGGDPQGFDPHLASAYSSFEVLENVFDSLVFCQ